jgi:DNA-binding response OmpR family regulator
VPGPSRPRVLVVEDVSALGDVIRDALAQAEFVVDTAATSAEALDRLAARPYAAIVADCILPDQPVLAWLAALARRDTDDAADSVFGHDQPS